MSAKFYSELEFDPTTSQNCFLRTPLTADLRKIRQIELISYDEKSSYHKIHTDHRTTGVAMRLLPAVLLFSTSCRPQWRNLPVNGEISPLTALGRKDTPAG